MEIDIKSPDDYLRAPSTHKNPLLNELNDRIFNLLLDNQKLIFEARVSGALKLKAQSKLSAYRTAFVVSFFINVAVFAALSAKLLPAWNH